MEIEKKLQKYGYGKSVSAIMIPLIELRKWSDDEILQLKDADINLIISPKIRLYLKNRFTALGLKSREVRILLNGDDN